MPISISAFMIIRATGVQKNSAGHLASSVVVSSGAQSWRLVWQLLALVTQ